MAQKYTLIEKLVLGLYKLIFRDSNRSLKKYSRNIYIVSILLLLINIASMWAFGKFEAPISNLLEMGEDSYDDFTDNVNIVINLLEVSLGLSGAFLDFTPEEVSVTS